MAHASLLILALIWTISSAPIPFPPNIGKSILDYGVRGDDALDDTRNIQTALADARPQYEDFNGKPKFLYFPAGTYRISDTLAWIGCAVTIQGQGVGATVFRLNDLNPRFSNAATPRAVWQTPAGNMSFRQNFHDLTINTGRGNPGAVGLDYISSNSGTVSSVEIVSQDGNGFAGLDMVRDWPGPQLLKNLNVRGFRFGIRVANSEYGPTFEHIRVEDQDSAGILNLGNVLAIRDFTSVNACPAIDNRLGHGYVILLAASMTGGASSVSAIQSQGFVYGRGLTWNGYGAAINHKGRLITESPVKEFISDSVRQLFGGPKRSLGLPVEETPEYADADTTKWARFTASWYGDTGPLQGLLNSGKSTVYLPSGVYYSWQTRYVTVPATVKRIIGFHSVVNHDGPGPTGIVFQVNGTSADPLVIEQFGYGVAVEHASSRTVAIKHGCIDYFGSPGAGSVFFEDVQGDSIVIQPAQHVWMRQFNPEGPRTHILNNGGYLWLLGVKTEGKGTVIKTTNHGYTELLGTLLYPCASFTSTDGPAFISEESSASFMYRVSSYVNKGGYLTQVTETRGGITRQLTSDGGALIMPLFAGFDSTASVRGARMVSGSLLVPTRWHGIYDVHGRRVRGAAGTSAGVWIRADVRGMVTQVVCRGCR